MRHRAPALSTLLTLALLLAPALLAAPARAIERPHVTVVRATGPIHVDGILDEPDWARAVPITDFQLVLVREGQALSQSLRATKTFPSLSLDMIEVGESSGALAPMLTSVAEFYEDEVNLKLGAMVALIEPIMLIFMGILVAFILISLYLPIFSLSSSGITK